MWILERNSFYSLHRLLEFIIFFIPLQRWLWFQMQWKWGVKSICWLYGWFQFLFLPDMGLLQDLISIRKWNYYFITSSEVCVLKIWILIEERCFVTNISFPEYDFNFGIRSARYFIQELYIFSPLICVDIKVPQSQCQTWNKDTFWVLVT